MTSSTYFLQLFEDPPVFAIKSGRSLEPGFALCRRAAKGRPFHVLVPPCWDVALERSYLVDFVSAASQVCPEAKFQFMTPTEPEAILLRAHGLQAFCAHQNAFIDETIFKIDPTSQGKDFRAVHNAALMPWKRHRLAWNVDDIAVITYRHNLDDKITHLTGYKHLAWSNAKPDGTIKRLSSAEVAGILNRSKSGMILSALEGANYASAEYQFCGLPVITTRSKGGRSAFLDPQATSIVWPFRWAVERAVAHWDRNPLDPEVIRNSTIQRAVPHRLRVLDWLKKVTGENVHAKANANAWYPTFNDKIRARAPYDQKQLPPPILTTSAAA